MTILESGIIAGALAGAAVGARLGGHHGFAGGVGGAVLGVIVGAAAGWVFAMVLICLMSFFGVVWRAARGRGGDPLCESDMRAMTPVAVAGTFASALVGLGTLLSANGWVAAIAMTASVCLTALVAVAKCELRRAG